MFLLLIIITCFAIVFLSYRHGGPNDMIWLVIGIVLIFALLRALGVL